MAGLSKADPHAPAMSEKIGLSSVDLTDRERGYARDAIDRGWISSAGDYVSRFEVAVAERCGRSRAIATSSGTSALDLVLRALDIGPGDEVICPALTFAAPASAIVAVGAVPVFADVTENSWTLDPCSVEAVRSARTKALIAVDVLGHPCDYDALGALGIPIVEDAAEAHGAGYRGRPVGSFGRAAVLSFHANKTITTGEGGCVLVDDAALAERIGLMNNHGMSASDPYVHTEIGRNYRMGNVCAAIGLGQVQRWDELVAGRRRVAKAYDDALSGTSLSQRPVAEWAEESVWLYTVLAERTDDRASILAACRADGIDARAIWPALPDLELFRAGARGDYRVAREIAARGIWLPTWSSMTDDQIDRVVTAVCVGLAD